MSRVVHQIEVELSKKQNAGSYGYIFYLPNVTETAFDLLQIFVF